MDIVTTFKDYAESLGIQFDYGTKAMTNLLSSEGEDEQIYLLLSSPIKRETDQPSEYGGPGKKVYSGNFLFVVKSRYDEVIYRQNDQDEQTTKYVKNVVPLFSKLAQLKALVDCSDYVVETWEDIDGYNLLDTNTDGLVVTFKLREV